MKIKLFMMTIGLSACALVGCETTSNTNVNLKNLNSNTAVVVNSNVNTLMNANSNRRDNTNVSREEYDKNRGDYEKEKGSSTIGQGVNDSWLWFKTKTALATTNDLRDSTINVDVVNDVVTLKGTVGSAAEKTKAEQVAKGIDGVKSVKNELKVAANDSMTNQMVNGNTSNKSNSNVNKK
ncbi:MAG TPA: BON domain-containing protein [Pyrinomonadaceae bacterium]|nr:BON domain-containing protein [Pyrinomonadaceae bacterium]